MLKFIARRTTYALLTLLVVSMAVYAIFAILPFDPAALSCGKGCRPNLIEANRVRLGFDKPIWEQYWLFLSGIFVGRNYGMGDAAFSCPAPSFGYSFNENACVTDMLKQALPVTLSLAIGALIIWLAMGVGLGVLAAKMKNTPVDTGATIFVLVGTSLPVFVTGLLFLVFLTIKWNIIPLSLTGYISIFSDPPGFFIYFLLPWLTLALNFSAIYTRFTRSAILETASEDYIRTAVAKGLSPKVVLRKHTLRAALSPLATMAGLDFAALLGGAILTETIYNLPGLGRMSLKAVYDFDLSVVVATTLFAATIVILMNLIVDILYAYLDPRVRIQ
jgi:peptide/nickel transport system permease protein